ncbi:MAG: glycosyltransferase, partial [Chitinophagales bacterium]
MKKEQAAVLFIPKWFPGRNDPQNGVFILKHARAISAHYPVKIMHLCPVKSQKKRFETEFEHENNIEILHCYYRSFQSSFLRIFNLLLYLIAFYKTYNRLFPKTPPLLSHAHVFTRPAALAFILRVWKGTPYIVSEHWTIYLKGKFNDFSAFKKFTVRHLANKSEAITAVSKILLNTMKQCGIYSKRMIVIGNAVPAPENITATKSYTKKIG